MQVVAPTVDEYVPPAQLAHVLATEAPVAAEYLPAPQEAHSRVPVATLYLPAAHAVHVPPLGPVYPVLQTHTLAALGDCEFARQS